MKKGHPPAQSRGCVSGGRGPRRSDAAVHRALGDRRTERGSDPLSAAPLATGTGRCRASRAPRDPGPSCPVHRISAPGRPRVVTTRMLSRACTASQYCPAACSTKLADLRFALVRGDEQLRLDNSERRPRLHVVAVVKQRLGNRETKSRRDAGVKKSNALLDELRVEKKPISTVWPVVSDWV